MVLNISIRVAIWSVTSKRWKRDSNGARSTLTLPKRRNSSQPMLATHRSSEILLSVVAGAFGQGTPTSFRRVGQRVLQTKLWLLEFSTTPSGKLLSKAWIDSRENSTGKTWAVTRPSSSLSHRNWMIGMTWLTSHSPGTRFWGLSVTLMAIFLPKVCKFWTDAVWRATWCLRDLMPPLCPMSNNRVRRSTMTCAFKFRNFDSRQAKLI